MRPLTETDHPPDPLAALRAATASRHERLDSGLPLGADGATLQDYCSHLRMLQAWLAPLGAWLATHADGPAADPLLDLPAHHRAQLALIAADLRDAGCAGDAAATTLAPPAWPAGASAAYRWGACYVAEGSALGGAVLYGRLAARLAPHPLRYLQGSSAGPGPRWRTFMLALRAAVRTEAEIADACAGARGAFDRILAVADACS